MSKYLNLLRLSSLLAVSQWDGQFGRNSDPGLHNATGQPLTTSADLSPP